MGKNDLQRKTRLRLSIPLFTVEVDGDELSEDETERREEEPTLGTQINYDLQNHTMQMPKSIGE